MRYLRRSRKAAEDVLARSAKPTLPIDVFAVARKYALVIEKPMSEDLSGMLVPLEKRIRGKTWMIVVNSTHPRVRQRFTVAHELGHLLLHDYTTPHADSGFKVRFRDLRSSDGSVKEEIEANQFAAELLMPSALVLKRVRAAGLEYAPVTDDEGELIAGLAREFAVSAQAFSIRLSSLFV